MKIRRTFHTIDTHTGGEPTRNVIGGIPSIPGATMREKMLYMRDRQDWVRRTLTYEPRGNDVMSGTVVTPPCDPAADVGVLFFEVGGWMPMCGHDTIGVATALVESGMVEVTEPVTHVTLDTAAGLVRVSVQVEDGCAKGVTFVNAPRHGTQARCVHRYAGFRRHHAGYSVRGQYIRHSPGCFGGIDFAAGE